MNKRFKIKVTDGRGWYIDKIGEVFLVERSHNYPVDKYLYIADDIDNRAAAIRYIGEGNCKVVRSVFTGSIDINKVIMFALTIALFIISILNSSSIRTLNKTNETLLEAHLTLQGQVLQLTDLLGELTDAVDERTK